MNLRKTTICCALFLWVPFSLADERAESEKGFKGWDKNGDGFLVPSEVPEGPRKLFEKVDKNGDGKVTLDEHLLATVGPEEPEKRKEKKDAAAAAVRLRRRQHLYRQVQPAAQGAARGPAHKSLLQPGVLCLQLPECHRDGQYAVALLCGPRHAERVALRCHGAVLASRSAASSL